MALKGTLVPFTTAEPTFHVYPPLEMVVPVFVATSAGKACGAWSLCLQPATPMTARQAMKDNSFMVYRRLTSSGLAAELDVEIKMTNAIHKINPNRRGHWLLPAAIFVRLAIHDPAR